MFRDNGWNTDFSCRNSPSGLYPCPCEKCSMELDFGGIFIEIPYGVLFDRGSCNTPNTRKDYIGSLWLDKDLFGCEDSGWFNSLKSCTFTENTEIDIWTDENRIAGSCGFLACAWGTEICPRIIICPS